MALLLDCRAIVREDFETIDQRGIVGHRLRSFAACDMCPSEAVI